MENSHLDPITGLYSHRFALSKIERLCVDFARHKNSFSILYLDIDGFKSVNDQNGLNFGDAYLRALGREIQSMVGGSTAARFGGDDFLVLMQFAPQEKGIELAEKMRERIAQLAVEYKGRTIGPLTVTIGVSCFPDDGENALKLLEEADLAVTTGKNHGKNCVLPARNSLRLDAPPY